MYSTRMESSQEPWPLPAPPRDQESTLPGTRCQDIRSLVLCEKSGVCEINQKKKTTKNMESP